MNNFTPKAKYLWGNIPTYAQKKFITNVWCVQCQGMVTIIDFDGEIVARDLVLRGKCKTCGHEVALVIEESALEIVEKENVIKEYKKEHRSCLVIFASFGALAAMTSIVAIQIGSIRLWVLAGMFLMIAMLAILAMWVT